MYYNLTYKNVLVVVTMQVTWERGEVTINYENINKYFVSVTITFVIVLQFD